MPSDAVREAVTKAAIASRYDEVVRALRDRPDDLSLDQAELDEALRLADWCRRLSADRQRLQHVTNDLELDEQTVRDQLFGLLGGRVHRETATRAPQPARRPELDPDTPQRPTETPRLALWVLGRFRLAVGGQVIIGGHDDRSTPVLRYLACNRGAGVHKEQLADRFWPGATARVARRNLHQSIYTIRRQLGGHGAETELVYANDHYRLGRGEVWRDIDDLTRHLEEGRRLRGIGKGQLALSHLRQADLLYEGELLADHPYDEWAYSMREHYRILHREAAAALLDVYTELSDHVSIVQVTRRLLDLDPADEDACRRLMAAQSSCGQHHLAAMTFTNLVEYLRDSHGLEPSHETAQAARSLTIDNRIL